MQSHHHHVGPSNTGLPKDEHEKCHKLSVEVENAYRYHVHGEDRVVNCPAPLVEIRVRVAKCGQRIRNSRLICFFVIVPASTFTKIFRGCYVKYTHATSSGRSERAGHSSRRTSRFSTFTVTQLSRSELCRSMQYGFALASFPARSGLYQR